MNRTITTIIRRTAIGAAIVAGAGWAPAAADAQFEANPVSFPVAATRDCGRPALAGGRTREDAQLRIAGVPGGAAALPRHPRRERRCDAARG